MQKEVNVETYDDVVSDNHHVGLGSNNPLEPRTPASTVSPGLCSTLATPVFGKLPQHNLEVSWPAYASSCCSGCPLRPGARKGFIGTVTGEQLDQRLGGSLAAAAISIANGASVVRVHDVKETVSLVRTLEAVRTLRF